MESSTVTTITNSNSTVTEINNVTTVANSNTTVTDVSHNTTVARINDNSTIEDSTVSATIPPIEASTVSTTIASVPGNNSIALHDTVSIDVIKALDPGYETNIL